MSNRGGPFVEDRVVRIRRSGSGRRSYLAIAPLAAALVAVAVIGALGPRAGSNAPASSPTAVATGGALARDGSGLWNEPGDVTPPASSDPATELGLGMVTVDGGSLNTLLLPGGYAGDPMAIDGHRVFMGHDNLVVEFDLDASGDGRTVLDLGVSADVVQKSGAFYSFRDERIGQGRANSKAFLQENPDITDAIEGEIRERAGLPAMPDRVAPVEKAEPVPTVVAPE